MTQNCRNGIHKKQKIINRECDGYIEVKYMGITRKTKVVEMKKEKIIWNDLGIGSYTVS